MTDYFPREESGRPEVIVAPSRIYVETAVLMALALAIGGFFLLRAHDRGCDLWMPGGITLAVLGLLVYTGISWLAERIEIHKDRIAHRSLAGWRRLGIADIRGFQILSNGRDRYVVFLPSDRTSPRIKIRIFLQGTERLVDWARERFPELEADASEDEVAAIQAGEDFGADPAERASALGRIRFLASGLNFFCALVFFWILMFPHPRIPLLWTMILCPIPALVVGLRSRGLVRAFSVGSKKIPELSGALVMPALGLALHAAWQWNLPDRSTLLMPMVMASVASILVCFVSFPGTTRRPIHWVLLVVFCTAYGSGATVALNALLDKGTPKVHEVFVLEKHIRSRVVKSYEVLVGPGVNGHRPETMKVDRSAYGKLRLRERAIVRVMPGRFGTPWCVVVPMPAAPTGP